MTRSVYLTRQEQAVVSCLLQGMSHRQACCDLGVTSQTYKHHLYHIGVKLDIDPRIFHLRVRIVYLLLLGGVEIRDARTEPDLESYDLYDQHGQAIPVSPSPLVVVRERLRASQRAVPIASLYHHGHTGPVTSAPSSPAHGNHFPAEPHLLRPVEH